MAATDEDLPPTDAEICQAKVVFERGAAQQLRCTLSSLNVSHRYISFALSPLPRCLPRYLGEGRRGGIKVKGDDASRRLGLGKRLSPLPAGERMCAKSVVG